MDIIPGDGLAQDASGNTSLRAAIMEANAFAGADDITLPAGTFTLSIVGTWEDAGASGDLDILDDLMITGAGQGQTIIDGASIDRVLDVPLPVSGTTQVTIRDLDITGGRAIGSNAMIVEDWGGGLRMDFFTKVDLERVTLIDNAAPREVSGSIFGFGGAISSTGTLSISASRIENNSASNSGGAIHASTSGASTTID
ncbi:MAG: hypothetical protein KDA52_10025, partial [Planctomycetaceae bacterium]|nr:hypothetical protein [Planctomycetaceae bacterium]